jgi:hypothetical protein
MTDLKTKLLEADGGSRELDLLVWAEAKGLELQYVDIEYDNEREAEKALFKQYVYANGELVAFVAKAGFYRVLDHEVPNLTDSLDAALALVEEVLKDCTAIDVTIFKSDGESFATASVDRGLRKLDPVDHKSPAIALCLALLSALEGEE